MSMAGRRYAAAAIWALFDAVTILEFLRRNGFGTGIGHPGLASK
jgi:hypothetical protein